MKKISIFIAAMSISACSPDLSSLIDQHSSIRNEDLKKHVRILSSADYQGRLTGTRGEEKSLRYVEREFQRYGLQSLGLNPLAAESFRQAFEFVSGSQLGTRNYLKLNSLSDLKLNEDFRPLSFSQSGGYQSELTSDIVFAGYGIQAPEENYDSYRDLNVKDRWVLVFRYLPENADPELRKRLHRYSDLASKARLARNLGAKGILIVSGPNSAVKQELVGFSSTRISEQMSILAVSITDALAESLVTASGYTLKALQDRLDNGEALTGFTLSRSKIEVEVEVKQKRSLGFNVIGRLDPVKDQGLAPIVIGAHLDHLGPTEDGKSFYFGADDNASGVAALLELSQYFSTRKNKLKLKRPLIFAAWSGEELGTLGSLHFTRELKGQSEIAAYINFDMVGRLQSALNLQGLGSSSDWASILKPLLERFPKETRLQSNPYLPTDSTPFYLKKVPVLAFFTGSHEDYHSSRDVESKINYLGLEAIAELGAQIITTLALRKDDLIFQSVEDPSDGGRRGFRVSLGLIPSYTQEDPQGLGLLLEGVKPGSPADRAGLRSQDRLMALSHEPIENIYDLVHVMGLLRPGSPVSIKWRRENQVLEGSITPESRE